VIQRLSSITEAASHVFVDSERVQALRDGGDLDPDELLLYRSVSEGPVHTLVVVGEDVPEDYSRRRIAGSEGEGTFRVTSGRVVGVGVLQSRNGRPVLDPAALVPEPASAAVPPGSYIVTAYEVSPPPDAEARIDEAVKEATPLGAAAERVLGRLIGALVFVTLIVGGIGSCDVVLGDASAGDMWRWVRTYGPWYAGLWVVLWVLWKWMGASQAADVRELAWREYPNAVIQLQRLGQSDGLPATCVFGRD
jgi:hypothetical protein